MTAKKFQSILKRYWMSQCTEGSFRLDEQTVQCFLDAPMDVNHPFQGPPGSKLKNGRGKVHPRYGRFIYAIAKTHKPHVVVEVGTYAGGTAIWWAKALRENQGGRLLCVDNDTYSKHTYPELTRLNLMQTRLKSDQFELLIGDSKQMVPQLSARFPKQVDFYLVDGDHTYEGARLDILNGFPMMKSGSWILVHDVDRNRRMDEMTEEHPYPVYEAFMEVAHQYKLEWCILKFIRKHLGILKIS